MKYLSNLWWKIPYQHQELICVIAAFLIAILMAWAATHA